MKRLSYFIILCVILLASSCDGGKQQGSISIAKKSADLSRGSTFISVVSDQSWDLSIDYEGEQKDWLTLNRQSGSGNTNSVVLSYSRNDAEDPRYATITVRFPKSSASLRFTQTGLSDVITDAPRGWMELPATNTEKAGFSWIWHDMTLPTGKAMRNYSCYYSHEDFISHWVAYPLNQGLKGSGDRTDKWAYDPKLPQELQGNVRGYYTGYARGHQLPSADRLHRQANEQTFYSTNIVPQKSEFNGGIWVDLEGKVRTWMNSFDTLYVVTGCVPSEKEFSIDNYGRNINVPKAFYKVLLGYRISAASKEKYSGIAFYLDHDTPKSTALSSAAMSITAIEEKLDMNFFVNLPEEYAEVENVVSDKFRLN